MAEDHELPQSLYDTARRIMDDLLFDKAVWYGQWTESPIETAFAVAFFMVCSGEDFPFVWRVDGEPGPAETDKNAFFLEPQYKVGKFRLDFLITYRVGGDTVRLGIECDGHDFHEKSKKQAQRDKSRDRYLLAQGVRVMRFTGSELFQDAYSCALEAHQYVSTELERAVETRRGGG